jgi:ribonucleoside-diphosphate reductase alpha chain
MLGVSTGIEPEFALSYKRRTLSLNGKETVYKEDAKIVKDYKTVVGNPNASLPSYIITSYDIPWKDRIAVQAAAQKYIDTAISSTCNLPKNTTVEEVEQIYLEAWRQGLKGFTIYRNGSRDPILFTEDSSVKTNGIIPSKAPERPKELPADFNLIKYKGDQFTVVVGLLEEKPYEIFAYKNNIIVNNIPNHRGKIVRNGSDDYSFISEHLKINNLAEELANMEEKANTVYPSQLLRYGVPVASITKTMTKLDDNIASFSSSIRRILSKYEDTKELSEKCPDCGEPLIRESGCTHCNSCGYSKCG